jgi:hypothetical protein
MLPNSMRVTIFLISFSFPSILFAQLLAKDTIAEPKGAFIVYVTDSATKTPLELARIRIYDENKALVTEAFTRKSGYDTISVAFGQYEVIIDKPYYYARTKNIGFNFNPNYKKNYYALICPISKSGITLTLHKPQDVH